MNYISTRNNNLRMDAAQAIVKGLAPDGGLMTPCVIPTFCRFFHIFIHITET